MMNEEIDFPRGGKRQKKNEVETGEPKAKPKQGQKDKQISRKRVNAEESPFDRPIKKLKKESLSVEKPLQTDVLCTGIVVLACIRRTYPHNIIVSLPGNQSASVPITEISEAYSQQLSILAKEDESEQMEPIVPAADFFKPGLYLPIALKSIEDGKNNRKLIQGSFKPQDINAGIPISEVKDGMLLMGSVSSVEDHGYRMEFGMKGLHAFLKNADAASYINKYNSGEKLSIGQPLWCVASSKNKKSTEKNENRVVNVLIDPELVESTHLLKKSKMNCLLPGTKVTAHVKTVGVQGLLVSFSSFEGVIHHSHLPADVSSYVVGAVIETAILYVHPESKTIQLSGLNEIVKHNGRPVDLFEGIDIGDVVKVKIQRLVKKAGLYLKLPQGKKGFAALSQLTDGTELPDINNYKVGQDVKCRAMGFNYMENLVLLTLKPSVLDQKFISVKTMKPGDFLEASIVDVTAAGVSVFISKHTRSFISATHMANVPISQLDKKFETGMVIKCRVMQVNEAKTKIWLTHKPALMKTKPLIPVDYSQLEPDAIVLGVITAIKDSFVIVKFFNNVAGIVLLSAMGLETNQNPQDLFYVGQVVRSRVINVDADNKKLKLSFKLTRPEVEAKPEKVQEPLDVSPGMICGAKIVSIGKDSYKLMLVPSKYPAYLPFTHLSDYSEIREIRRLTLSKGDQIPEVAYFDKRQKCTVTLKESLLKNAKENSCVQAFSDLEEGMLLPSVIKNHQQYGLFVELIGGFTGLVPYRTIRLRDTSAIKEHYPEGRSVLTRVVRIDKDKERFLGAISKQDCARKGEEEDSWIFLQEYLEARQAAMTAMVGRDDKYGAYGAVAIGSVVEVTVTSVHKKGVLCELASGLKAIATEHHLGEKAPEAGKQYNAVVLDFDVLSPCLEVSLDQRFCNAVQSRTENPGSQVRQGQSLKAGLVLVKQEFLLMKLKGHGAGKLVYVPAKKHMNDLNLPSAHEIGMYSNVTIKGNVAGFYVGVFKFKKPKDSDKKAEKVEAGKENMDVKNLPLHNIQVGDIIEAKVKAVHDLQLNIVSNRVHGRVHISEASDDIVKGKNPLSTYHTGQTVKVKVIGLRNVASQSITSETKDEATRTTLECSLKLSKLGQTGDSKQLMSEDEELAASPGDQRTVYVTKVDNEKIWVQASIKQYGFISLFLASKKVDRINNAKEHFTPGMPLKTTVLKKMDNGKFTFSLIELVENPEVGDIVTALIKSSKSPSALQVRLYNGHRGVLNVVTGTADSVGTYVRCKVKSVSEEGVYHLTQLGKQKALKQKSSLSESDGVDEEELTEDFTTIESEPAGADKDRLTVAGFAWGGDLAIEPAKEEVVEEDDDDDDNDDTKIGKAVADSKLKKKRGRDQERIINEYEKQQLEGSTGPQSVNDFERLVLQSPNSSVVWLGYMAYHLGLGEVAKARIVAEKALDTIVFREEQEKKNVWLAYLNLETLYGDSEDLKKLIQRAVMYNDPLDIHLKMCDIYVGADKLEEAEQQYNLLMRKFKKEKVVWKSFAQFLYKQDKHDAARNILKRCLTVLEKRDHVEVISRFANLEFSHGNPERGRTMFENLLASYPGRTDIWSVYVDMVVKSGDIDGGRQLLQRATTQKLNTKKVSFLIQKFIKFEETHGTEEHVQKVKDLAVSLFDS